jgi:phosphatidylserine decarboxylase
MKHSLYTTKTGRIILESLVKRAGITGAIGRMADSKISRIAIPWFKNAYGINMEKFIFPEKGFKTLNDFFIRDFKPEYLKFPKDNTLLASPAEGYLSTQENVNPYRIIQAKGKTYSIAELINESLGFSFDGGTLLKLRLTPKEYHNFHFIDNGRINAFRDIDGSYYSSDICAVEEIDNLYPKSHRHITKLNTQNFGNVIYAEIGATFVGTIVQNHRTYDKVIRSAKKGYFKFGGSTVILLFEKDKIRFDSRIRTATRNNKEVYVNFGEVIGRRV